MTGADAQKGDRAWAPLRPLAQGHIQLTQPQHSLCVWKAEINVYGTVPALRDFRLVAENTHVQMTTLPAVSVKYRPSPAYPTLGY